MKVVYTDEALHDLDDILKFIAANFPAAIDRSNYACARSSDGSDSCHNARDRLRAVTAFE